MNPRYGGRWSILADEILHSNYGKYTAVETARRINQRCGTSFTADAVYERAVVLGVSASDCQGQLTVAEAARRVGLERDILARYLVQHDLETTRVDYHRFLTDKTWQIVQEVYPVLDSAKWMSTIDAGKRMHYGRHTIVKLIRSNQLTACKRASFWYVLRSDVERLERIQQGRALIGDTRPDEERKRR